MIKSLFFTFSLFSFTLFAQVGIGTNLPAATLDVVGRPNDVNSIDAIIPPRMTGNQLRAKNYSSAHDGAIVYVTESTSIENRVGQVENVRIPGLYVFNYLSNSWSHVGTPNFVITDFNSVNPQLLDKNSVDDQTITFTSTEAVVNTATTFDDATDTFTILQDGDYQVSAYVGFNARRSDFTSISEYVAMNLKVLVSTDNGVSWDISTGVRAVFVGATAHIGTAIQVPTTLVRLVKGNQLKLVIQRPEIGTVGSNRALGDFEAGNGHINRPTGQAFTKSLYLLKIK